MGLVYYSPLDFSLERLRSLDGGRSQTSRVVYRASHYKHFRHLGNFLYFLYSQKNMERHSEPLLLADKEEERGAQIVTEACPSGLRRQS